MIGNVNALNADVFHHVEQFTVRLAAHGCTERGTAMSELVNVLRSIDTTLGFIFIVLLLMLFFKKMG